MSTDPRHDADKLVESVRVVYGMTLTIPLLSDPDARVIGRYGLDNGGADPGPESRKYATPATYIVDERGVVRWRMIGENFKMRPPTEVIAAALAKVKRHQDASGVTLESVATQVDPAAAPAAPQTGSTAGMVLIPAGAFTMGDKKGRTSDSPAHTVQVDAFYIDRTEVTNEAYRAFLRAIRASNDHRKCHPLEPRGKDHTPALWNDARFNGDKYPVVGVDWFDAYAYAAWAGKALPTEAQYERAARGGVEGQGFPWGNEGDERLGNVNSEGGERAISQAAPDHVHAVKPVASYKANGFGVHDMTGNVEEWCRDWYAASYYATSPAANPPGPDRGVLKVVRGGSWHHGYGRNATRYNHQPDTRAMFLGFRCVRAAGAPPPAPGGAR